MKPTPNQIINMAKGVQRIRDAVNVAWVIADLKPYVATNCRTMFSERTGNHTLLAPINNEKDNQKNTIRVQAK